MKPYSDLAHVPWAIAIQLVGVLLLWAIAGWFGPASFWVCGIGGVLAMFARDEAKEEYDYIAAHGGLRANMPDLIELKFWTWTGHDLWETIWSAVAVAAVALVAKLLFVFHVIGPHA